MRIDAATLLFFDASCLIAAAGSPNGGSGYLLSLCRQEYLRAAVSQPVLLEAERNIAAKLGPDTLHAFHHLLLSTPLSAVPVPPDLPSLPFASRINTKDLHVVASALTAKARFVITLDRPLAGEINLADLGLKALTPGDFIKLILPYHADYTKP